MNRSKKALCLILPVLLTVFSCSSTSMNTNSSDPSPSDQDTVSRSSTTVDSSPYAVSVADQNSATYSAGDVLSDKNIDFTAVIDLSSDTAGLDGEPAYSFQGGTVEIMDGVTVQMSDNEIVLESVSDLFIRYMLTGITTHTLTIESAAECELYLDEATITASSGPGLIIASSEKVFISTAPDTENLISDADASSRTEDLGQKASLYSKGTLIIGGEGVLTVEGSYKHGIYSAGYIRVTGGTMNVYVSERDAIRSVQGFIFDDGDLVIEATGTALDDESKGIKVEGEESPEGAGLGFIVINGGILDITSVSKGITASFETDEDGDPASDIYDPNPDVVINSGIITITTTGESYETVDASCSPEGIEGKDELIVNSGYIVIESADDCLNAGSGIEINGGYIYCASTSNDAIDSNGTLSIAGGVIVSIGAGVPEGAFDCDWNTFSITGGIFIGLGGSTSTPSTGASTQPSVILSSFGTEKGDKLALVSSSGECVFVYDIPVSANTVLLSSPYIANSTTYTLYLSGDGGGTDCFEGLYLDDLYYTPSGSGTSFTVSSNVTIVGGGIHGPN